MTMKQTNSKQRNMWQQKRHNRRTGLCLSHGKVIKW